MKYKSTRSAKIVTDKEALVLGMAPDGGLFVPQYFPKLAKSWSQLNYTDLAGQVLSLYFPSLKQQMADIVSAYDKKFPSEPVKLTFGKAATILELYHGPTLAFKDMALSVLPKLIGYSLPQGKTVHILTATSGDTGKAALEGFADVPKTKITVFYPDGKVSPIQERQMLTQQGNNVAVYPVAGNFDDCQRGVKALFTDKMLADRLAEKGILLASANSINIGRLVPQIVYYIYAYFQMVNKGLIKWLEKIHISVPTGNFGNILAAYYAKQMGLPVDKLICANNQNRVLTDFFTKKHYSVNRELVLTSSPSMDILVSSNLERLLYHLAGERAVNTAMNSLNDKGEFSWSNLPADFCAYTLDEAQCSKVIAAAFEEGILLDPHTAIAYGAATQFSNKNGGKVLVASTASPYKFPQKILQALSLDVPENAFDQIRYLSKYTNTKAPAAIEQLEFAALQKNAVIDIAQMKEVIL